MYFIFHFVWNTYNINIISNMYFWSSFGFGILSQCGNWNTCYVAFPLISLGFLCVFEMYMFPILHKNSLIQLSTPNRPEPLSLLTSPDTWTIQFGLLTFCFPSLIGWAIFLETFQWRWQMSTARNSCILAAFLVTLL